MALVDFRVPEGPGSYIVPRKPVTAANLSGSGGGNKSLNRIGPDLDYTLSGQHKAPSSFSAAPRKGSQPPVSTSSPYYHNAMNTTRRTPSTSTTSTTNTTAVPTRTSSTTSSTLGRTASSRSGASITTSSYVALMRKQKATVWCDRAQREDPRILAQLKIAKVRAAMEVSGGMMEGRNSTGSMGSTGVRSKIRHHGTPKAIGYNYANPAGGGVPMRLSATEVGDEGNDLEEVDSSRNGSHQRTNSGKSSGGSNKLLAAVNQRQPSRYSQGSLRTNGQGNSPNEDIPELEESPYTGDHQQSTNDYFSYPPGQEESGSSSDFESGFGEVGQMKGPTASRDIGKAAEDLRRRGSVDERSNTMGGLGGKLYVMNPDPD